MSKCPLAHRVVTREHPLTSPPRYAQQRIRSYAHRALTRNVQEAPIGVTLLIIESFKSSFFAEEIKHVACAGETAPTDGILKCAHVHTHTVRSLECVRGPQSSTVLNIETFVRRRSKNFWGCLGVIPRNA
jgi:hypothetical protein